MASWRFGDITARSGTPARRELAFYFEDGTPRTDLADATGYLRVYSDAGVTTLFPEVILSAGTEPHRRVLSLTAAQTTQAKSRYYAEIEFRDGGGNVVPDSGFWGELVLSGR